MDKYDLIFYLSRKTSYCEKRLKKLFKTIDFEQNKIVYCTESMDLGELLCKSLNHTKLVILVGGLSALGDYNLSTILSRVLSSTNLSLDHVKKLKSKNQTAFVITYKTQIILAVPDNPNDIDEMLNEDFLNYVKKTL